MSDLRRRFEDNLRSMHAKDPILTNYQLTDIRKNHYRIAIDLVVTRWCGGIYDVESFFEYFDFHTHYF